MDGGSFRPAYLATDRRGLLDRKVEQGLALLESCTICPRNCRVNRLEGDNTEGVCHVGRHAKLASYFPHRGEEDCLRGRRGSGTIFLGSCNLRCVFCQNHDISHGEEGAEVTPEQLAAVMLELQGWGCHNINFVSPSHVVPQILEAIPLAVAGGLNLPLVYNTGGYDSLESLELLDGVVDIYMPDFKFMDTAFSRRYLPVKDYPARAKRALREMHRQVGDLVLDEDGIALRGLLVRHLVMPGGIHDTRAVMRFLAKEISTETFVNVMAQYRPVPRTIDLPEINHGLSMEEYTAAVRAALDAGLHRLDRR